MKCTDCQADVKPVVALDIDGTLGDYHGHFLAFLRKYIGWNKGPVGTYTGARRFKEWATEVYSIDERTWHDAKLAYRQGGMKRSMPAFLNAATMCRAIKAAGAELWLTTTRPYLRLDNVDPDTRFWLELHGFEYDHLIYDEEKYELLASLVGKERVAAVVDDEMVQVEEARRVFGHRVGMLRKGSYNFAHHAEAINRRDLPGNILMRIQDWKADNE
jgi:hypothetical protein